MSTRERLKGPLLKIKRANHHIANLEPAFQAFRDNDPYTIRREHDADAQKLSFFFANCKPLDPDIPILIGEALYQLRSSLDYLVWQLFEEKSLTPLPKSGFPIMTTAQGYKARSGAMIKGIATSAVDRIEKLQPFHSTKPHTEHPLWVLQELNNADKHRLLIVAQAFATGRVNMTMKVDAFDVANKQIKIRPTMGPMAIEDDALVASIPTKNPEKEVDFEFGTTIAIKEIALSKNYAAVPLLKQLSSYGVIKSFEPEFT
jgi:hypothetical protein